MLILAWVIIAIFSLGLIFFPLILRLKDGDTWREAFDCMIYVWLRVGTILGAVMAFVWALYYITNYYKG